MSWRFGSNHSGSFRLSPKQVRVTGKNRDDLQAAIALVKKGGFDLPFQFTNFRD